MTSASAKARRSVSAGHARLREIISQVAILQGQEMTLASGKTASLYFDMRMATLHPESANLIAEEILDILRDEPVDCVGGLVVGAVPIIAAVSMKSHPHRNIPGFFIRKEAKGHGTQKLIDGNFKAGDRAVLLEDVTTSGGSVLQAVKTVRDGGGHVSTVITVVDRLEGAEENLARDGVTLIPLFTKDDFLV
jgi:orotate phosphoribosyltransferase